MMQLHLDETSLSVAEGAWLLFCSSTAPDEDNDEQARHARQHYADLPAFPRPGAEPGRKRLAVSPPELARKHRL